MELELQENENEAKDNSGIIQKADGILGEIAALIEIAKSDAPEEGETSEVATEQATDAQNPALDKATVQTMISAENTMLKIDVRKMLDYALANLPQNQQEDDPFADRLTDKQLTGEVPY